MSDLPSPSLSVLRDQAHQAEAFFQGWTDDHTGWLIVLLVILVVWYFKPGKGV